MQKLNPPSRVQAAGLIVATLVFANLLAFAVLSYNLRAMVYPIGGDAIMIPIVNNLLNSLCILVLGTAGAMLPLHRIGWRLAGGMLLLMAGIYALSMAMYWWYPQHYGAGAAFAPVVLACIWALRLPMTPRQARPQLHRPADPARL